MTKATKLGVFAAAIALATGPLVSVTIAIPWAPNTSAEPAIGNVVPTPAEVPGKDFSEIRDRDFNALPDVEQVVAWDGLGGVRDSFDYSGSRAAFPDVAQDTEVDGIAAGGDALFQAVRDDQAALLFSVQSDPTVLFERATGLGGPAGFGVWATAQDIDATNPPLDTDALEVWGGDNNDDTDRYSLVNDPAIPGTGKIAVWSFAPPVGPSAPHTLTTDLAAAMDLQYFGIGEDGPLWNHLVELMDVDAIMMFGPQVTFSIQPLDLSQIDPQLPNFDGGEIFEYISAAQATEFLDHGGHLWNSAFDIRGTFGVNSENVDALEAVATPEPGSLTLLLGSLGMLRRARRR